MLKPEYVARLVEALEQDPRAVLAFCDVESNIGSFAYTMLEGIGERFERARQVVLQHGEWWVPNRGLMGAAQTLGGMRRYLAGEVGADLPWLLRLTLLGEFVRVPEPLIRKAFRTNGLSAGWRKSAWNRIAVQLACLQVARDAGFPMLQALRPHREALVPRNRRGVVVREELV